MRLLPVYKALTGMREDIGVTKLTLANYNSIPRVTGMVLSPDGRRAVLTVQTLNPDSTRFVTSLWEVTTDGEHEPRRLTFSEKGETSPSFLPDGSLVFVSGRTDPTVKEDEAESRLWLLHSGGGEARTLVSVPGGVRSLATARTADALVIRAQLYPGSSGLEADLQKGKKRKEAGVSGILYDTFPIRFWDHDLGPRWSRLLRVSGATSVERPNAEELTGDAINNLEEASICISPDGKTVITEWERELDRGFRRTELIAIKDGHRLTLDGGDYELTSPQISPDGRRVVAIARDRGNPGRSQRIHLWLGELDSGKGKIVAEDFSQWPSEPQWAPNGTAVFFAADQRLHRPIFQLELASGTVTQITTEGAFTAICPDPSGVAIYALRNSLTSPLELVRVDLDGSVTTLPTPGFPFELPGDVSSVTVDAADRTPIHAWLVMPRGASPAQPAPLVLWVHGGPLSSWNTWNWRWCPHLLAERGYAVLMPDPALSTGYGDDFVQRAWAVWGDVVMDDVFSVLDHVLSRPDIDSDRVAEMGGSFGGYMSNWIAGHAGRFRAIVTHASLWSMKSFQSTTDEPDWWELQFGSPREHPERYEAVSPSSSVANIHTPMLVIHGNLDYRVPISEALQLWTDLRRHNVPSQYLYFPDENHWVLKPGNAFVWYQTVLAFLDHHVLDKDWQRPELL